MTEFDPSIRGHAARITHPDEMQAFSDYLRNPPAGMIVKQATEADWQFIANRKIELAELARHDAKAPPAKRH